MDARRLCKRADGLNAQSLRRLTRAGLIPADGRPRKSWPSYTEDAVLLAKTASAFVKIGGAAMDAQSLLVALLAMPPSDREAFAQTVILARYARGTSRVDWHRAGAAPYFLDPEPLLVPLRDFLDAAEPQREQS